MIYEYDSQGNLVQRISWEDGKAEEIRFAFEPDPLPAGADFSGFCDPCGGFRKHRLGCPVERAKRDAAC